MAIRKRQVEHAEAGGTARMTMSTRAGRHDTLRLRALDGKGEAGMRYVAEEGQCQRSPIRWGRENRDATHGGNGTPTDAIRSHACHPLPFRMGRECQMTSRMTQAGPQRFPDCHGMRLYDCHDDAGDAVGVTLQDATNERRIEHANGVIASCR